MMFDIQRLAQAWRWPLSTIMDVGANRGQSALLFRTLFPNARILSFEPHPDTYAKLQANIAQSPNVQAFNLALGDSAGEVDFFEYDNPLINSRVADAAYAQRKGFTPRVINVTQRTIDDFSTAHGLDRIDFLKIDTEGFERSVLAGATGMLTRSAIGFVSCEVGISDRGKASDATELAKVMKQFGYTQFSIYYDYVIPEPPFFANGNALFIPPLGSLQQPAPG
jgi:FkbM family methyltransferase